MNILPQKRKNEAINGFRFMAMCAIFLSHLYFGEMPFTHRFGWLGPLGVDLFIILSGYCITLGYFDSTIHIDSIYKFMKRRLQRLYPIYFLGVILGVIYYCHYYPQFFAWWKLFSHLTMTQTLIPAGVGAAFNDALWTVATLFFCYMFTPFFFSLSTKKLVILIAIGYILSIILDFIPLGWMANFLYRNPIIRIWDYAIGILFARFYLAGKFKIFIKLDYLIIAFLLFLSILSKWFFPKWLVLCYSLNVGLFFFILSYESPIVLNRFLRLKIMQKLGKISYAFYSIHCVILLTVGNMLLNIKLNGVEIFFIAFIEFVACLGLAVLVDKWYDEPIQKYIRKS